MICARVGRGISPVAPMSAAAALKLACDAHAEAGAPGDAGGAQHVVEGWVAEVEQGERLDAARVFVAHDGDTEAEASQGDDPRGGDDEGVVGQVQCAGGAGDDDGQTGGPGEGGEGSE